MADPVVTDAFASRLGTLSTPYVDTLNARPATLPNIYTSIEVENSVVDRITIGSPAMFRESGTIAVKVNVRSGGGDSSAETLAETVRDLFHNYAVGHFRVETVGSAVPLSPDEGNYFQLRVPVVYQYDFFK